LLRGILNRRRVRRSNWYQLQQSGRITVGRHTYGFPDVQTFDHDDTRLVIGPFCSIAEGVTFVLGGNHPMDRVTTFPLAIRLGLQTAGSDGYPWSKGDVVVGPDVWIATGATILSGVTIGTGAVIAAGSVVTKDVRPYAIVAGVPAREVGRRFEQALADKLLASRWWEWDDETIIARSDELTSPDVAPFAQLASSGSTAHSSELDDA
jgi:acetyltransferase-like isoleucine patch superfamily enzyme